MKLPELPTVLKMRVVLKTLAVQACLLVGILVVVWGLQRVYAMVDTTTFPDPVALPENADQLSDNEKGKILLDAITHQLRYELNSPFGWSFNDIVFNRFVLDNRAYRQYGVYHATKFLLDLYSSQIAKLGSSDRESEFLYKARINSFAMDPRSFMFPSAEGSYKKGLKLLEQYKDSLDKGTGVYNCRTDDLYASFVTVTGENMLGYALGLRGVELFLVVAVFGMYFADSALDGGFKPYQQGIALVLRDFINTLYVLYPEIRAKNNESNMAAAMDCLNRICTYDPLYITSSFNSGELILSYLMFAKARLEDIRDSIRI